jgi:protein-disulfide isomerase
MDSEGTSMSTAKAVIIGAVIIAVVVVVGFLYQNNYWNKNFTEKVKTSIAELQPNPAKMRPISATTDHILGDPKASVKLVVYTDLECPYCKTFHNSISELKSDYIKDGKIAIVYRNMPLDQLHSKARGEAAAAECAAKLGGNDKYWAFVDKVFAATPSNNGLDQTLLPKFAADLGLDAAKFASCVTDKAIADKVQADEQNGIDMGGQGTPFPVVVKDDKVLGPLNGALPADQLRKLVDQVNNIPAAGAPADTSAPADTTTGQ